MSTSAITGNKVWRLISYPEGPVTTQHLRLRAEALPETRPGQVKVKIIYLSVDPANRLWIRPEGSYMAKLPLGTIMPSVAIGEVVESKHPQYAVGQMVQGMWGWQEYVVVDGGPVNHSMSFGEGGILHLPTPPEGNTFVDYFGVLGIHGLTAYFGVLDVGQAKAGETLLVSAAAGAIGSLAVQVGKNIGCRVIGIAGGPDKCKRVVDVYGADACIDYKSEDIAARLAALAPGGINVFFDNVGGEILETAIAQMGKYGRIIFCGAISQYNERTQQPPKNYIDILYKELQVRGFLGLSFLDRMPEAADQLAQWKRDGRLCMRLEIHDGIESCLSVLNLLFEGTNNGKLVVRL